MHVSRRLLALAFGVIGAVNADAVSLAPFSGASGTLPAPWRVTPVPNVEP